MHPSVEVTKTGDAFSKTGDTITYQVTIKNTGDTALELDSFSDTLVPGADPPAACDTLAANDGAAGGPDECSFSYTHTVTATEGAGETLANTATAHYDLPDSYSLGNDITDSDEHTSTSCTRRWRSPRPGMRSQDGRHDHLSGDDQEHRRHGA